MNAVNAMAENYDMSAIYSTRQRSAKFIEQRGFSLEEIFMMKLPEKYSKKWLYITILLFFLTFISLYFLGKILNINIGAENISGFALLSFYLAIIISIGGYLGATVYFCTAVIFHILGIIYMIYVSINRTAEGWSDLVSILSFLLTVGIGIFLGLVLQGIRFLISKRKR
jgi:hypothetical protein